VIAPRSRPAWGKAWPADRDGTAFLDRASPWSPRLSQRWQHLALQPRQFLNTYERKQPPAKPDAQTRHSKGLKPSREVNCAPQTNRRYQRKCGPTFASSTMGNRQVLITELITPQQAPANRPEKHQSGYFERMKCDRTAPRQTLQAQIPRLMRWSLHTRGTNDPPSTKRRKHKGGNECHEL